MSTQRFVIRTPADLGRTISEGRLARGVTQQELANRTGIERAYLSRMEGGLETVQVQRIFATLRALGIRLEASMDLPNG